MDGLTLGDLTVTTSVYNGITATSYFSPNGDRLMLRDITPDQIDQSNFF